jgi:hypothetical protein
MQLPMLGWGFPFRSAPQRIGRNDPDAFLPVVALLLCIVVRQVGNDWRIGILSADSPDLVADLR